MRRNMTELGFSPVVRSRHDLPTANGHKPVIVVLRTIVAGDKGEAKRLSEAGVIELDPNASDL